MPIVICPHCHKRVVATNDAAGTVHECKHPSDAIQYDSIPKMGKYEDFSGSGDACSPNLQGLENKVEGTIAGIQGARVQDRNVHGDRKSTHRLRQHYEFIPGAST